jgi:hypothetical protein
VQTSAILDVQAGEQPVIVGSAEQMLSVGQSAPTKATRQRLGQIMNAMRVLFLEVAIFRVLVGCGIAPPHLVIVHERWTRGTISAPDVFSILRKLGPCGPSRDQSTCFHCLWPEGTMLLQCMSRICRSHVASGRVQCTVDHFAVLDESTRSLPSCATLYGHVP